MTDHQAEQLAIKLLSGYPGRQIAQMHVAAIGSALRHWDLAVGEKAVAMLWERAQDPPSVAAVMGSCREAQASLPKPALPPERCPHGVPAGAPCEECDRSRRLAQAAIVELRKEWAERAKLAEERDEAFIANRKVETHRALLRSELLGIDPNRRITRGGPLCGFCGRRTLHDGGDLWYCGEDGWVTKRTPRNDKTMKREEVKKR